MSKRYKSVWDAIENDPHVAQHLKLRSELLITLQEHLRAMNKTQQEIADMLGVHQPRVSALFNGKVEDFSLDSLVDHAAHAGLQIALKTKPVHA